MSLGVKASLASAESATLPNDVISCTQMPRIVGLLSAAAGWQYYFAKGSLTAGHPWGRPSPRVSPSGMWEG
jgi:hypothetical protein